MNVRDLQSGFVKLEFGNKQQITLIDEYQKGRESSEDKHFRVEVKVSGSGTFYIWAKDEDKAERKVVDENLCDIDTDIESIEIVEDQ